MKNQITDIEIKLYEDLVNGASRLYMLRKWFAGAYGNQITTIDADEEAFNEAYNLTVKRLKENIEQLSDDERDKLYSRYLSIYKMAVDIGNLKEARGTLDSMAKLQGLSDSGKNIRVRQDKENDVIEISFGLD